MKKYSMFGAIKNWIERTPGYSWCQHCGKTWDKVESKSVPYDAKIPEFSNSGMFPLCTKCFDELNSDEILEHCRKLTSDWKKDSVNENINFDVVKYNINCMKGE